MTASAWKQRLADRIPPAMAREIDDYETDLALRRQGKVDEKVFAETRLRRGAYGQRYDNGQRHDGIASRTLDYPSPSLTKGPSTLWDAPGMQRIKIPFGAVSCEQLEVLADLADEYSDGILHVTTRQDIQLHFVHIDDTPTLMRRLAAVGITTREACGNTVRNVTACPLVGVCPDEAFDVGVHALATARFLLGHPDTQDFGRKFKVAFSGCAQHACGLASMHDMGLVAVRRADGAPAFSLYVGGGLGAVPHQAKLFDGDLPAGELLPIAQAISRVFARLGEKQNRARARLKFLVARLGLDEFRRLVLEERARLPVDPRWTAHLGGGQSAPAPEPFDGPLRPGAPLADGPHPAAFASWYATNAVPQRQPGYAVATVTLPLGDLTVAQAYGLAGVARRFCGDTLRLTVEQNVVLRWVSEADLPELFAALAELGLGKPGAGTIADVTACPGTDTCKLGISSSRGLARELVAQLSATAPDPAVRHLRIKTSGCFNSCGQHHVADLGFLGVSRNVRGRRVPHFQVVLGGQWSNNAGAYGLAIGAVPSKRVPEVLRRITDAFVRERRSEESFQDFTKRIGKARTRALLEDLLETPSYEEAPGFYSDWGDPREYTIGDLGVGECAGEVVSFAEFGLAAAEREVFEAQLLLDAAEPRRAAGKAYASMVTAAKALIRLGNLDISDDHDHVVGEFRERLVATKLFSDPFVGDKFAHFLLRVHDHPDAAMTAELAHQRIEEATLFIDAAHACHERLIAAPAAAAPLATAADPTPGAGDGPA